MLKWLVAYAIISFIGGGFVALTLQQWGWGPIIAAGIVAAVFGTLVRAIIDDMM